MRMLDQAVLRSERLSSTRRRSGMADWSLVGGLGLGALVAIVVAGLLLAGAAPALAVQNLNVTGRGSGGDSQENAGVWIGGPGGRYPCSGYTTHDGMHANFPELHTSSSGGGRWTWTIAAGVPRGRWQVHVTCHPRSGALTASTSFTASAGPHSNHRPRGLVQGQIHGGPWTGSTTGRGSGGGGGINFYPRHQCTWLVEHFRPDLPYFPGPSGNAANWLTSAQHAGFATGTIARTHAVVVFAPGQREGRYKGIVRFAGRYGHVAFVKKVHGSKLTLIEANLLGDGRVDTRVLSWRGKGLHFIYGSSAPPPNGMRRSPKALAFYVYRTCANGHCGLQEHRGAGQSTPSMGPSHLYPDRTKLWVVCQIAGQRVVGLDASSTNVWDQLSNGGYVSDYYVTTPEKNDHFSVPIPPCGNTGPLHVTLKSPVNGSTLTGTVTATASSNAPTVAFNAYYSTTPGVAGSATWHHIATVHSSASETFKAKWNTAKVPNQGYPGLDTVQLAATAIDADGTPSGAQSVAYVSIANPQADGTYAYNVQGTCRDADCKLNLRSGPGYSTYPIIGHKNEGDRVSIRCQAIGEGVSDSNGSTDVWDKLASGAWASDFYIDTPNPGGFSAPIPRCATVPPPPNPRVSLTTPAADSILSGMVKISATSNESAVRFDGFYSTTPGVPGSASWHTIATVTSTTGTFSVSWDTSQVPDQGQPTQNTVEVRVTALDGAGQATGVVDEHRVNLANESPDGTYHYHVYGTCGDNSCQVNLRSGPGFTSYSVTGSKHEGDEVDIVCQTTGEEVSGSQGSSAIWDQLSDGSYVSDYYIDTPRFGSYSPPVPTC